MDPINDRHSGTLDGQFVPLDEAHCISVVVAIPQDVAPLPACQHTMWMLINLLARAEGIVDHVYVEVPQGVPLAARVVPLAARKLDLRDALLAGGAAINAVPVSPVTGLEKPGTTFDVVIGPGNLVPGATRVHGEKWWGGFSTGSMLGVGTSPLPLGPYVAAALAAGEIFKSVRLFDFVALQAVFYSTWTMTVSAEPILTPDWQGPDDVDGVEVAATLAGVGAVGSTWVHAFWAALGITGNSLLADADKLGIDTTNLNRCPIFGRSSVGSQKASEAARICADADINFSFHNGTVGSVSPRPPLMISAVDTNRARQAVQSLYPPRLLSGSTHGLRAEVLRCDPVAGAACIHCFNPLEPEGASDTELRRHFLAMDPDERRRIAAERKLPLDQAIQWATDGTCGYIGDQIAAHLRPRRSAPEAFAVGFVSVMAGTMLAALTLHEVLGAGPLSGPASRAVFQFFDPLNHRSNSPKPFARQSSCEMCDPASHAALIWKSRFQSF